MTHVTPEPDALQQVIDRWLASLGSPHTRSAYRTDVQAYVRWCATEQRTPLAPGADTVAAFRRHAADTAGPATVARRAAALNAFLRYAGASHTPPATALAAPAAPTSPADGAGPAGTSSTVALEADERDALLESIATADDTTPATRMLVALLLLDGLKLDEILRLDVGDVTATSTATPAAAREVRVALDRAGDPRVAVHPVTAATALTHVRGRAASEPLFVSASRREAAGTRLSRFGAGYLLREAGRRAGLDAPLTSNVLRRTHAEHARAAGDDVDAIARRMGHDDVRSTRRYLSTASPISIHHPTHSPAPSGSRRRPDSQEV